MVRLSINSTTSGDPRKPVSDPVLWQMARCKKLDKESARARKEFRLSFFASQNNQVQKKHRNSEEPPFAIPGTGDTLPTCRGKSFLSSRLFSREGALPEGRRRLRLRALLARSTRPEGTRQKMSLTDRKVINSHR